MPTHKHPPPAQPSPSPPRPQISLQQPCQKKTPSKPTRLFRRFRSVFNSLPIINPPCRMPSISLPGNRLHDIHGGGGGGGKVTGTLFGHRKSRVNLVIQENPRCLPILVLELSIQTGKLLQDMGSGLVRIALECEKHPSEKTKLVDEPIWMMYSNGRKSGYGVKREATDDDLSVMQILHAVSMGAGVLPFGHDRTTSAEDYSVDNGGGGGERNQMTYMRAFFERVVGSKDSETYYMLNPDKNTGPELSIFFVRV